MSRDQSSSSPSHHRSPEVDAYLAELPAAARAAMDQLRALLHEGLPGSDEVIRYGMPTLQRGGRSVVHVAAWKRHVSVYPVPEGDAEDPAFDADIAPFSSGRGTAKFGLSEELPLELVRRLGALLDRGNAAD